MCSYWLTHLYAQGDNEGGKRGVAETWWAAAWTAPRYRMFTPASHWGSRFREIGIFMSNNQRQFGFRFKMIGILLPNNQRQHRTFQKDVLPCVVC